MAAETYQKCTCGHNDVLHSVKDQHPCRVTRCDCLGFLHERHVIDQDHTKENP